MVPLRGFGSVVFVVVPGAGDGFRKLVVFVERASLGSNGIGIAMGDAIVERKEGRLSSDAQSMERAVIVPENGAADVVPVLVGTRESFEVCRSLLPFNQR